MMCSPSSFSPVAGSTAVSTPLRDDDEADCLGSGRLSSSPAFESRSALPLPRSRARSASLLRVVQLRDLLRLLDGATTDHYVPPVDCSVMFHSSCAAPPPDERLGDLVACELGDPDPLLFTFTPLNTVASTTTRATPTCTCCAAVFHHARATPTRTCCCVLGPEIALSIITGLYSRRRSSVRTTLCPPRWCAPPPRVASSLGLCR